MLHYNSLVVLIFCLTFKGIVLCVFNAAGTDDLIMRILFHIQNIRTLQTIPLKVKQNINTTKLL